MKKLVWLILGIFVLCMFAVGCSSNKSGTANQGYSVMDKRGVKLDFKEKPKRIVSLFPSSDEILFSMVDHSRILALSSWARDPIFSNITDKAKEISLVASNSPEFLMKNKADLVITRDDMGQKPEMLKSLNDMGIPVYVFDGPQSINGIKQLITKIGEAVGEKAKAKNMVDDMDAKLADIRKETGNIPPEQQKKAVFWSARGIIGGKGTLVNDILKQAQVKDILEDVKVRGPVSKEMVITANPDYIIVIGFDPRGGNTSSKVKEILSDRSFANVNAVKNKNVVLMPIKYTSCNSQYVVESVAKISKTVYGK